MKVKVTRDSAGRRWIVCPNCGKKIPGWYSSVEVERIVKQRGEDVKTCRYCGTRIEITEEEMVA